MKKIYELFMLLLIFTSLSLLWVDFQYAAQLDFVIWLIFVIDYVVRLMLASDKKSFVRTHLLDLLALIPLDNLFRSFRIVQVFRVFRLGIYMYRYARPFFQIMQTNGLDKILTFTLVTIFLGAAAIYMLEPEIGSLADGLWWAIVTTTTVGYGDISPKTGFGRMVAVVLMFVGIGTIGMITGSIATYFLSKKETVLPNGVKHIQDELNRFHELDEADLRLLIGYMESLIEWKKQQGEKEPM